MLNKKLIQKIFMGLNSIFAKVHFFEQLARWQDIKRTYD